MKVVIVGGVAGGASAAARIRRLDEHAQIVMIERSGYISYANCGLPYYVGFHFNQVDYAFEILFCSNRKLQGNGISS